MSVIEAGSEVPEFTLQTEDGEKFGKEDLLGQTSVLVFYPFAFSPVCNDQLTLYEEVLDEFTQRGATLYAISTDARWSQAAFKEKLASSVRQLSDFEPKGATAKAFGVLHDGGFTQRALVITGPDGVVKWSYQAPSPGELPGPNLIFDGLDAA
ncbi:MAG TPA: redoxin domain-containing protein [Solirubrobacteraceae bacterium]|nr:redoxin domain-containing protein [Solirubrobacteraceae bacterium]